MIDIPLLTFFVFYVIIWAIFYQEVFLRKTMDSIDKSQEDQLLDNIFGEFCKLFETSSSEEELLNFLQEKRELLKSPEAQKRLDFFQSAVVDLLESKQRA